MLYQYAREYEYIPPTSQFNYNKTKNNISPTITKIKNILYTRFNIYLKKKMDCAFIELTILLLVNNQLFDIFTEKYL